MVIVNIRPNYWKIELHSFLAVMNPYLWFLMIEIMYMSEHNHSERWRVETEQDVEKGNIFRSIIL